MTNEARLAAAMMSFALELQAMGLSFAGVVLDPELQQEHETRLYFVGNVSVEGGEELLRRYLEMLKNPAHEVKSFVHVKMDAATIPM